MTPPRPRHVHTYSADSVTSSRRASGECGLFESIFCIVFNFAIWTRLLASMAAAGSHPLGSSDSTCTRCTPLSTGLAMYAKVKLWPRTAFLVGGLASSSTEHAACSSTDWGSSLRWWLFGAQTSPSGVLCSDGQTG